MGSGIQSLRTMSVRDENNVASALLIGHTAHNNVAIGVAPERGNAAMVILTQDEVREAIKLMTAALRGDMS